MATYAISDIHGAYDEFRALLKKIDFHFDGRDTLYLLGDYADWGEKSIETLIMIREMDQEYSFVHCLMGNHELMFLQTVDSGYDGSNPGMQAQNWLYNNRGSVTWNGYAALEEDQKKDLIRWMRSLRYSCDVSVGGVNYMLAHAYPYYYDMYWRADEIKKHKMDAVWRRLLLREDPFAGYKGVRNYDCLICGHTISDIYYQEARLESSWPLRITTENVRNRIFKAEKFIDIDCGAKCMDIAEDAVELLQLASMRAQLAALRLEDLQGFYVHRAITKLAEQSIPELTVPELHLPQIRFPELNVPELHLPQVRLPEMHMPEMHIPEVKIPEVKMPQVRLPQIKFPMPKGSDPGGWFKNR